MDNTIEIKGLCKEYKGFALDGVSFAVPRGYIMGLIGPNGAAALLIGVLLAGWTFLPFHFRLGFRRGMWSFSAAGFVLSVIGLNSLNRLAPAGAYGAGLAGPLPGILETTGRGLYATVWLIDNFLSKPFVIAACAGALAFLGYFSYRLSVAFFAERDL